MPNRHFSAGSYRYGFGGQEKDDEIKGVTGSSYNYTFRIYDSRLGRFLSSDPLSGEFPWSTSYAFAENRPVDGIDLEGLEFRKAPGMFRADAAHLMRTKIIVPSALMITNLRLKNIPEFYKMLKVTDIKGLEKAVASTQFKLTTLKPSGETGKPAENSKDAGEGVAGWLIDAVAGASIEVKAFESVKEQTNQIQASKAIVDKAFTMGLIPEQFQGDAQFMADLVNYVFDGSQAFGTGKKAEAYNNLISYLGAEIYANRNSLLAGSYKRPLAPLKVERTHNLDRAPLAPLDIKYATYDKVAELVKDYNAQTEGTVQSAVIKQAE